LIIPINHWVSIGHFAQFLRVIRWVDGFFFKIGVLNLFIYLHFMNYVGLASRLTNRESNADFLIFKNLFLDLKEEKETIGAAIFRLCLWAGKYSALIVS